MTTKVVTFDYETKPIQPLPDYPPKPVGLALQVDGKSHYYSWGHPTGNNCTEAEARAVLSALWFNPEVELVAHNLAFDTAVACKHWMLPLHREGFTHDTMVMAFLCDPHAMTYALKPLANKLLGMPPEEADAIRDWCITNGYLKKNAKEYGEYIWLAPGELVGEYAIGDVERAAGLFHHYKAKILNAKMWDAYRREIDLQAVMLENTFDGVAVDVDRLTRDIAMYDNALAKIDTLLFDLLKCEPFNINSGALLADAIDKAHPGLVWTYTKTGKRSTSKANMEKTLEGLTGLLLAVMQYRASIHTCVNTFMRPWLIQATHPLGGGRMRCQWHTTRGDDGGARTGRLSSSPNMQNIPTLESAKFREVLKLWAEWLKDMGFPPLPNVRAYVVADSEDHVLCGRDYCLSPDTEFLTEDGFTLFDNIAPGTKLAYWDSGEINFEVPLRRIDKSHDGEMIHVVGAKSLDMLGTPDHRVLLLDRNKDVNTAYKVRLDEAPFVRTSYKFLPQAGMYANEVPLEPAAVTLVAAIQADGKITSQSTKHVVFKFSKQRKIDRLCEALRALKIEFEIKFYQYEYDSSPFTWIIFYVPAWVFTYIDISNKLLTREILTMPASFLDEITYWDGTQQKTAKGVDKGRSAQYYSVYRQNVELVQELAVLRNRHSVLTFERDINSFNKAGYYSVCIHKLAGSFTKTQKATREAYTGRVVCFEMPHGTLVVRRNGRPFVTGNCAQELRVLAHFEDGVMIENYNKNPAMDMHQLASDMILELTGLHITRKQTKTVNFAITYGSGLATLAGSLGCTTDEAAVIKAAYLQVLPGIARLNETLKARAEQNKPIRTWGGRVYYVEPSRVIDGRCRNFAYKMLNVLIQGSSADITKEACVRYAKRRVHGRIVLSVHDEVVMCCPKVHAQSEMAILKECMEGIELDVKLITDGEYGQNWFESAPEDES